MPITNVTLRHSKKGEVETTIIEFHLSGRERPYSLYVNNFTDAEGLKNQLSGLAHIIPPVEAAEQSVHPTLLTEPVNYCNPVNGVHAPFCTGHKSQSG